MGGFGNLGQGAWQLVGRKTWMGPQEASTSYQCNGPLFCFFYWFLVLQAATDWAPEAVHMGPTVEVSFDTRGYIPPAVSGLQVGTQRMAPKAGKETTHLSKRLPFGRWHCHAFRRRVIGLENFFHWCFCQLHSWCACPHSHQLT